VSVSGAGVPYVPVKYGATLGNQGQKDTRRNGTILFKENPELIHGIIPSGRV